jgi:hypothetical protein
MEIYYSKELNEITLAPGKALRCTSVVRNEINRLRPLHDAKQVIRSIPSGKPIMPRAFPIGRWRILGVKFRTDGDVDYGYLGPAFIQTNAFLLLPVWALDENGGYDHVTSELVADSGYGFHFARDSRTTQGCGRLDSATDALAFAKFVQLNDGSLYVNVTGVAS